MQQLIHKYFVTHLELDDESAELLHQRYYKEFGLAIEGLVRFNKIDAMAYNAEVDDALPLDGIMKPDPDLRKMLLSIDRTKVKKLWLLTNAYINHARRVVRLLGVDDLFDGITYCDYAQVPLICKPKREMFHKAMEQAGVDDVNKCYFVDDSYINIVGARKFGFKKPIQYVDADDPLPEKPASDYTVRSLLELPQLVPEVFKIEEN
ncbi:Sdt1p [Sugiyamaella lignohabitans]|uniref:Sdt1p n=1 Tax=Sugiyamaella lignohabitans TaxID=796027 RepID=A0A167F127_9ASCO|nr:Sdt1p [Sugiyamaella lignohabitans]ANB14689.1 Sdt1p [Sugiyamaella lignohabitans]